MLLLYKWNRYCCILLYSLICLWTPLPGAAQDTTAPAGSAAYEWEIDKHERYLQLLQQQTDSLKRVLKHRWVIGITYGVFLMPGYTAATIDEITGVNLRDKKTMPGISLEYFFGQRLRIAVTAAMQNIKRVQEKYASGSGVGMDLKAEGGFNIPVLVQAKYTLTNKNNSRPKLYAMGGIGFIYTKLITIEGNPVFSIDKSSYMQTRFSSTAGMGLFQRLGKIALHDLSVKYLLSSNYKPDIGSVNAYSGIMIVYKLGFILNGGFSQAKKKIWQNGY